MDIVSESWWERFKRWFLPGVVGLAERFISMFTRND